MTRKIILKIGGMECPNCAMILERIEDTLAGVQMAEASYHKGQLIVEYDDTRITEERIHAEIQRLGYSVLEVH